jgi:predicted nucleic acid-binding Zn ribbon protein
MNNKAMLFKKMISERRCLACGKLFTSSNMKKEACSDKCAKIIKAQMDRQWKSKNNVMNDWE